MFYSEAERHHASELIQGKYQIQLTMKCLIELLGNATFRPEVNIRTMIESAHIPFRKECEHIDHPWVDCSLIEYFTRIACKAHQLEAMQLIKDILTLEYDNIFEHTEAVMHGKVFEMPHGANTVQDQKIVMEVLALPRAEIVKLLVLWECIHDAETENLITLNTSFYRKASAKLRTRLGFKTIPVIAKPTTTVKATITHFYKEYV